MDDGNTYMEAGYGGEALSDELERDARRYDKAFAEEEEVKPV